MQNNIAVGSGFTFAPSFTFAPHWNCEAFEAFEAFHFLQD